MRVCVANPPAYLYDHKRHFIQAGSRWSFSMDAEKGSHAWPHYQPFPFSLAYATSMLKEGGFEVDAFDGCALDMDEKEFLLRVERFKPDLLIVEVPTVSFPFVMRLLREVEEQVGCDIAVAGPHVTAIPTSTRYKRLIGEWESLPSKRRVKFEEYPFPDREFFPNELYSNFEFYRPSAQMLSSRGCPSSCVFCVERHVLGWGPTVRARKAENVVDEMEYVQGLGAKQVWFDDMSITARKDHVESLCREILKRGLDLPWTAMADMNACEETVRLMTEAGCLGVAFGVETVNREVLHRIGKPWVTKEKAVRFVKLLRKNGVYSVATFSLGLPGHTRESILEDIRFATEELGADSVQFSIATPFPGTPFYRLCKRKGWLVTDDWTRYDGARYGVVDYPSLKHEETEELFKYAMQLRKERALGFRK